MNTPSSNAALDRLPLERHRLANGLAIVLQVDERLPLVAINLWYHVGSKHERPGRTGFAHLFEHMLFQGSAHVGTNDHFRHVQQVGGVANGSTWYDRTNYYETLPAAELELGLWLESDRMGFLLSALTPEKLENQRSVVMNERRQRVDNQPYGRALETLFTLLFPADHPYHWPVIGWMEDIAAATLDDVHAFCREHYRPDNSVLTLVGAFDPPAALAAVERYFGELAPGGERPRQRWPAAPLTHSRATELLDRVQLPRLYRAAVVPPFGDAQWTAGAVASAALASGKSSLLYHDLVVERRLAQDVSTYLFPTEEAGVLLLVATAKPGVELDRLGEALDAHLAALAHQALHESHLERARNGLLHALHAELEALDRRADLLSGFATFFDDPGGVFREAERYRAVGADEVRQFATAWCGRERWAEVRVLPEGPRP